jgi:hypothetical protein
MSARHNRLASCTIDSTRVYRLALKSSLPTRRGGAPILALGHTPRPHAAPAQIGSRGAPAAPVAAAATANAYAAVYFDLGPAAV